MGCTRTHVCVCELVLVQAHNTYFKLVFSGGLAPLAAQRVDGTGTEQQGGPPLGRAMAWPSALKRLGSYTFVFKKNNEQKK